MAKHKQIVRCTIAINEDDHMGYTFLGALLTRLNVLHASTKPKGLLKTILGGRHLAEVYHEKHTESKPSGRALPHDQRWLVCPKCYFRPCQCADQREAQRKSKSNIRYIGRQAGHNQVIWEIKKIDEIVMPMPDWMRERDELASAQKH